MTLDNQLFLLINHLSEFPWIRFATPIVTWLGDIKVVVSVLVILLIIAAFRREWRRFVLAIFVTVTTVSLVGVLLKPFTARPRPYLSHHIVSYLGSGHWDGKDGLPVCGAETLFILKPGNPDACLEDGRPRDFSFPSGHTLLVFGIAGLFWSRHKLRWSVLVLAILVGLSRIILGYHYPSDVLAGALLGFLIGYIVQRRSRNIKGGQTPLYPLYHWRG